MEKKKKSRNTFTINPAVLAVYMGTIICDFMTTNHKKTKTKINYIFISVHSNIMGRAFQPEKINPQNDKYNILIIQRYLLVLI